VYVRDVFEKVQRNVVIIIENRHRSTAR